MRIEIETVPPADMRYDTLGDWFWVGEALHIQVSADLSPNEAFLVGLHEMTEAWLCRDKGIPQEFVDGFDLAFEGDGEPGDDPDAPYRIQHRQAMMIEHLTALFLGLDAYGTVA